MIHEELPKLSKEELVDMVLQLQRTDKTSRTSSKAAVDRPQGEAEGFQAGRCQARA
jgi:hypothetical protein